MKIVYEISQFLNHYSRIGEAYRGMAKNQMMIHLPEARVKLGDLLKQGASWLVFGLVMGPGSSSNVKMVAELDQIKDMIFEKVNL